MRGNGVARRKLTVNQQGFDFTAAIRQICAHACARLNDLGHVRMNDVAVGFRQTRKAVPHGLQASLTPLRFEGGATEQVKRGRRWVTQRITSSQGRDFLYLLNFYLPRFLDQPFQEKLVTIFHELWHISPTFDGDLRRHEGRCYMHGPRQAGFDAIAVRLANEWLSARPPKQLFAFLQLDFVDLCARHGKVTGHCYPAPKILPHKKA